MRYRLLIFRPLCIILTSIILTWSVVAECSSAYQFVGVTDEKFDGSFGILRYCKACQDKFPGSRMCTSEEIIKSGRLPDFTSYPISAWVHPTIINVNPDMEISGLRMNSDDLTCNAWASNSQYEKGLSMSLKNQPLSSSNMYGQLVATSCQSLLAVACCASDYSGSRFTPTVKIVNLIPETLSGETEQDSEPFLALHPFNNLVMAASAFTPNPNGIAQPTAPIYISLDGGNSWELNNIIPSQGMTSDITHTFSRGSDDLYAGILRRPLWLVMDNLLSFNIESPNVMNVLNTRNSIDQPFAAASTAGTTDRLYIGNNDFNAPAGRTATVDVSLDDGANWSSFRVEARNTSGQDGPSVRPAISRDGTVYVAFFGWRNRVGNISTSDVVVVRDDAGGAGVNPFQDLSDPMDGLAGVRVARNVRIPWDTTGAFGQERIGSTLSLAVDPNNSGTVYIAWADRVSVGDYTIHLRRSIDRGLTWSGDLRTITNATNCALAVNANGTAGFLYQQLSGIGANRMWVTKFEQSDDFFTNYNDVILAEVPANTPARVFHPYIGDYTHIIATDNEFRGVFSANNSPDLSNFPNGVHYQRAADFDNNTLDDGTGAAVAVSIDPFYFSISAIR